MKISIIVPVYNVEKYLSECIDSLLIQNYDDYEIILVDDGSTDNSGKICDIYMKQNQKISVIHKKNGGLSDARNEGIKYSKGEYLMFVDSDDYICYKDFLKDINEIIINTEPDMIIYGISKKINDKIVEKNLFINDPKKPMIESLIAQNYFKASACDKIVKKELIIENELYFPLHRYSEDIEWCAKLIKILNFDKIQVFNKNVYIYRQRSGSITKTLKEKNITDIIEMIENEYISGESDIKNIVNSYLAYEYSVLLGVVRKKELKKLPNEVKNRVFCNKEILDFNISKKVRYVRILVKILGVRLTSKVLGIYIDLK